MYGSADVPKKHLGTDADSDGMHGQDTICTLESVKAVGEVYAPVDLEAGERGWALVTATSV